MLLEMNFRSKELKRSTQITVLLPTPKEGIDAPCKTLWLLHGLSGDHTAWIRKTSIERYAEEHGIAVVMPNVERSWYTDTAYEANDFSFVAKELPTLCRSIFRQMSDKPEDNLVAGLSMGGYGAMKLALTFPEQYGACISLSGSLDITRKGRPYSLNEWRGIFGFDLGSASELAGSEHDLFALAERVKEEGKPHPHFYMWCGTEDSLIEVNRLFDQHLSSLEIPHVFKTSEGDHSWKWWDLHIQDGLKWALETASDS